MPLRPQELGVSATLKRNIDRIKNLDFGAIFLTEGFSSKMWLMEISGEPNLFWVLEAWGCKILINPCSWGFRRHFSTSSDIVRPLGAIFRAQSAKMSKNAFFCLNRQHGRNFYRQQNFWKNYQFLYASKKILGLICDSRGYIARCVTAQKTAQKTWAFSFTARYHTRGFLGCIYPSWSRNRRFCIEAYQFLNDQTATNCGGQKFLFDPYEGIGGSR